MMARPHLPCRHARCSAAHAEPASPPTSTDGEDGGPSTSGPAADLDDDLVFDVPASVRERNAALQSRLAGQLLLGPLTRGGNVPYRRMCVDFGAEVTMSEMAFARPLIK